MECPDCALPVLIDNGTIQPHLRPDTLEQCTAQAPKVTAPPQTDDAPAPPAKKEAPTKAPSRPASKTKPHKS